MSIIVVLCLALYKLPPTAVAAMMCTERSSLPIEIDASTPTTTDSPVNDPFRFNRIDLKNIQEILGSNDIQQKMIPLARLSAGFWRRKCKRRRFTHRPKDVTFGRDGAVNAKNVTSDDAARILFGTENECVSTNPGLACVCCMTDFLDLICQRLDEAAVAGDDDENETAALRCRSFKPVPAAFVIYPGTAAGGDGTSTATTDAAVVPAHDSADVMVERNGGKRGGRGRGGVRGRGRGGVSDKNAVVAAPMGKEIDFDKVVNYQLEKSSDDHYAVQYALVGSDVKVQCLINGNGTRMNAFKWDFKKGKNTTSIRYYQGKEGKNLKKLKSTVCRLPPKRKNRRNIRNSSVISKGYGKLKNHLLNLKKKSKPKIIDSKIPFNNVHEKYGQLIQDGNHTEENTTD